MLQDETRTSGPGIDPTLSEIMHLVDMGHGASGSGWTPETARLFAIDIAMTVIRRHFNSLTEPERLTIIGRLSEARTLVVAGRDEELGFLQAALESHLPLAQNDRIRRLWLTAIDALIPSPHRAALIVTRGVLAMESEPSTEPMAALLKNRLAARLGEGELLPAPSRHLYLIV